MSEKGQREFDFMSEQLKKKPFYSVWRCGRDYILGGSAVGKEAVWRAGGPGAGNCSA